MLVRINWRKPEGSESLWTRITPLAPSTFPPLAQVALVTALLLTPSALIAFTMALWIIASDLKWTGEFFLLHGLFSHWQIWITIAGVLLLLARLLDRYASVDNEHPLTKTPLS